MFFRETQNLVTSKLLPFSFVSQLKKTLSKNGSCEIGLVTFL